MGGGGVAVVDRVIALLVGVLDLLFVFVDGSGEPHDGLVLFADGPFAVLDGLLQVARDFSMRLGKLLHGGLARFQCGIAFVVRVRDLLLQFFDVRRDSGND